MALKRRKNGTYVVDKKADAEEALMLMLEIEDAIKEIHKDNGIPEMMMDSTELKRAATRYFASKRIKAMTLKGAGKVAKLIEGSEGQWIGTKAEMPDDAPDGVRPLKSIVGKDMWKRITRRMIDPDKIMEAVSKGELDEDEISAAYYEKPRAPYVRLYDDEAK
jgi:hypothetical protein